MRKSLPFALVFLTGLLLLVGCHHKTQVVYFNPSGVVQATSQGDTLEWESQYSSGEFAVYFLYDSSPCVDDHGGAVNPVLSNNGVAKCKVGKAPYEGITYQYYIGSPNHIPGKPATGPQSCDGCDVNHGPKRKGPSVVPGQKTANPDYPSASVVIYCDESSKKINVTGPANPTYGIYFQGGANAQNWSVTFPSNSTSAPLCTGKSPLNTVFTQSNQTCNLLAPILPSSPASFTVTTGVCTTPQTFPVPVAAAPPAQ